jgi:transposase
MQIESSRRLARPSGQLLAADLPVLPATERCHRTGQGPDSTIKVGRLKQFRAIATRYDKRAVNFLAGVYAASIFIWLN